MQARTFNSALVLVVTAAFLVRVSLVHAESQSRATDSGAFTSPLPTRTEPTANLNTQPPLIKSDVGVEKAPTKTLKPTSTPTVTEKSSSPTPTNAKATETPTPTPTTAPIVAMSNTGGLDPEKLFAMSNEYRKSRGLSEFKKDEKTCALAASRAPEVAGEVASGDMHAGLRNRNLDYWNTENIISMRTEESAFNWWVNDKIHHDAIIGDFTYSCVACTGNSCAQEFTNYQAK